LDLPPHCSSCSGLLKPDFVFFGEGIPEKALQRAYQEASQADLFLLIGSSGEVQPACQIPPLAKARGARVIEINPRESNFTPIADVFLQGPATEAVGALMKELGIRLTADG
jgi:NAD-dependent deacetylase